MTKNKKIGTVEMVVSGVHGLELMSFDTAKKLAYDHSPRNYRQISDETKIPQSTLKRMLNDPEYNPSPVNIPDLCDAMGNTIMIEWLAAQAGCYLVRVESGQTVGSVASATSAVIREAADVMTAFALMIEDGKCEDAELERTAAELTELIVAADWALETIKQVRNA